MRILTQLLTIAALFAPVCNAMGQSVGDVVAYAALIATPTAGVGFDVQWGHMAGHGGSVNILPRSRPANGAAGTRRRGS